MRSLETSMFDIPKSLVTNAVTSELPPSVRSQFESAFNTDLSHVRVHEGAAAALYGAQAFAAGSDIHFAPGAYDPHSASGRELIGHELAHVVQQSSGRTIPGDGSVMPEG